MLLRGCHGETKNFIGTVFLRIMNHNLRTKELCKWILLMTRLHKKYQSIENTKEKKNYFSLVTLSFINEQKY